MNENSPTWARPAATVSAVRNGSPQQRPRSGRRPAPSRRPRASTTSTTAIGCAMRIRRVEQHPDRHEEQHREGVAQRQRVLGGPVADRRLVEHHAGEERAERERDAEQRVRGERDPDRDRQHRQREQLARAGAPRPTRAAAGRPARRRPASVPRRRPPSRARSARPRRRRPRARRPSPSSIGRERRQQDQRPGP